MVHLLCLNCGLIFGQAPAEQTECPQWYGQCPRCSRRNTRPVTLDRQAREPIAEEVAG